MFRKLREAYESRKAEEEAKAAHSRRLNARAMQIKGYSDSLFRMLADGDLSPDQVKSIQAQQRQLQLTPYEVAPVHRDAWIWTIKAALADGVLTDAEARALDRITKVLGQRWETLPPELLSAVQALYQLQQVQRGVLPVMNRGTYRLNARAGESVHLEVLVQMLDERVVRREMQGGSSGFSFRIAKGVSYRVGGMRGQSIPIRAVVPVDQGIFSITSSRLAYIGQKKSFSIDWPKVLSVEPVADGIHMSFTSRSKSATLQYLEPSRAELVAAIVSRYIS
jgi:hypothetical protein